jgi:hypothetical protein
MDVLFNVVYWLLFLVTPHWSRCCSPIFEFLARILATLIYLDLPTVRYLIIHSFSGCRSTEVWSGTETTEEVDSKTRSVEMSRTNHRGYDVFTPIGWDETVAKAS